MGAGLHQRLTQSGILPVLTLKKVNQAVCSFLENKLDRLPINPFHHCNELTH
jgi:hypothetical protein